MTDRVAIRPLATELEVALVASRMRDTLIEVLGRERGEAMYTLPWLQARVREHLGASERAQVFLAVDHLGAVLGHTIVRRESESDREFGLFSTTYVVPEARRRAVAVRLLQCGETWMRERGLAYAVTYTERRNQPLIALFLRAGYSLRPAPADFVQLERALD